MQLAQFSVLISRWLWVHFWTNFHIISTYLEPKVDVDTFDEIFDLEGLKRLANYVAESVGLE